MEKIPHALTDKLWIHSSAFRLRMCKNELCKYIIRYKIVSLHHVLISQTETVILKKDEKINKQTNKQTIWKAEAGLLYGNSMA